MAKQTKKPAKAPTKPAAKPVAKSAAKRAKPAAKPAPAKSKPAAKATAKVVAKAAAKGPAKSSSKPAASKSAAKPASASTKGSPTKSAQPVSKNAAPAKSTGKVTAKSPSSSVKSALSKEATKGTDASKSAAPATGAQSSPKRSEPTSKTAERSSPSKTVVAAAAIGATAIGAAIGALTKKDSPNTKSSGASARSGSSTNKMANNTNTAPKSGDEGAELRIGVVQPATKNTPAMRLNVNDAEILATAKERYGTKDLEAFRKLIHEQRAEASEEFDILSEQMLDTSGEFDSDNQTFSLHTAEQGTDAMEREKTFLHAQRTSDYIKKLDEAIARIDRGTYGICVVCGKLIEKQRLQAVPITQKHVDCKNKTQQKKLSVEQPYRDLGDQPDVVE